LYNCSTATLAAAGVVHFYKTRRRELKGIRVFYLIMVMLAISGCSAAASRPASTAAEPPAAPTVVPSKAAGEVPIPAGWATSTGEQCKYAISYPSEMQVADQNAYSRTIGFKPASPDSGSPNFVYASVITPEIQNKIQQGTYAADVYNYDPAATDILLGLQVGEGKSVHPSAEMQAGFTYQRLPDSTLGGVTARTFENAQPWEFPPGTKEIRYYATSGDCTYLIGGYVDTTGSGQPGAIQAELFQQIIATVDLMP
jgi:hypothetical protein